MNTTKVTPATLEKIRTATSELQAIHDKMDFLQPLVPEQRKAAPRLGPKTVVLTAKRLEAARQHPDALPPSFDLRQFERQTALLVAIDDCRSVLERMLQDVRDTVHVFGEGALEASRAVVGHLEVAADGAGDRNSTVRGLKARKGPGRKPKSAQAKPDPGPGQPGPGAPEPPKDQAKAA